MMFALPSPPQHPPYAPCSHHPCLPQRGRWRRSRRMRRAIEEHVRALTRRIFSPAVSRANCVRPPSPTNSPSVYPVRSAPRHSPKKVKNTGRFPLTNRLIYSKIYKIIYIAHRATACVRRARPHIFRKTDWRFGICRFRQVLFLKISRKASRRSNDEKADRYAVS
jgi:hypothetical protein